MTSLRREEFIPSTVSDRTAELAGRAVALHEKDRADALEVLGALGLLTRLRVARGLEAEAS